MGTFGSKLFILLGLWLYFVQGTAAFASNLPALHTDEDSDREYLQTPVSGAAFFEQVEILEVQPVPQKEQPDLFATYVTLRSVLCENIGRSSSRTGFYFRDHRNDLKRQIFPFHCHW